MFRWAPVWKNWGWRRETRGMKKCENCVFWHFEPISRVATGCSPFHHFPILNLTGNCPNGLASTCSTPTNKLEKYENSNFEDFLNLFKGDECCSDHMISFHYVTRPLMYAIHNLVYHIRPFGLDQRSTFSKKLLKILKKIFPKFQFSFWQHQ